MTNRGAKGGAFERALCVRLSEWWSGGQRSDLFWRTSGSGARAKVRGKKGLTTAGHYGDISWTDPIVKPLLDLLVIETGS